MGDFDTFASAIRSEKTHLLLGLDSSIPGTPEVKDVDFHGRNGIEYPTLVAAKRGSLGNSSSFTGAAKQRPPSLAMPRNTKDAEVLAINSVKNWIFVKYILWKKYIDCGYKFLGIQKYLSLRV